MTSTASRSRTVEYFILTHAVGIPIPSETYNHQAFFFGQYGLVDMPVDGQPFFDGKGSYAYLPAGDKVGQDDGTHLLRPGRDKEDSTLGALNILVKQKMCACVDNPSIEALVRCALETLSPATGARGADLRIRFTALVTALILSSEVRIRYLTARWTTSPLNHCNCLLLGFCTLISLLFRRIAGDDSFQSRWVDSRSLQHLRFSL